MLTVRIRVMIRIKVMIIVMVMIQVIGYGDVVWVLAGRGHDLFFCC